MDELVTVDEVLEEILAFSTISSTTFAYMWSMSFSTWGRPQVPLATMTSTTSTTPEPMDHEDQEEEIPEYLEVPVDEADEMELQEEGGDALPAEEEPDTGHGVGDIPLEPSDREQPLAQHVAALVVAEIPPP